MSDDEKIEVENVNVPGHVTRVNKAKYEAMKFALLAVLPAGAPGVTVAQAKEVLIPNLPDDLFPGGKTSGWWLKCVQLDLEAKGIVGREATKPMQIHRK